jgi:hypothetical protein
VNSPPVQTPILVTKAGGLNGFSLACVMKLIEQGIDPDAFGSFNETRDKITKARQKCKEAKEKLGDKYDPMKDPDPATARLARSDPGHMSQNALYQTKRGDACTNHGGNPPESFGSMCYDEHEAPCMPHAAHWTPSSGRSSVTQIGTTHWRVGRNESEWWKGDPGADPPRPAVPPGGTVGPDQIAACSKETAGIAADGPTDYRDKVKPKRRMGTATRNANQDAALKKAAAEDLSKNKYKLEDPKDATGVDGQKGAEPSNSANKLIDGDTAEDCIENYRRQKMQEMRKKMVDKHSDPKQHGECVKAADEAAAKAKTKDDQAQAAAAAAGGNDHELNRKAKETREAREEAERDRKSLDCMETQAKALKTAFPNGDYPEFDGKVPVPPAQRKK